MKTSKEWSNLLSQKKLSTQIIAACAFSCNKRAKNARDKQRQYLIERRYNPFFRDKYNNEHKYMLKKESYYAKKDLLLSVFTPSLIHYEEDTDSYYLYYEVDKYKFHHPIFEAEVSQKYPNLEVVRIDKLATNGQEITELVSNQFVDKVINLIKSKDYTLLESSQT